MAEQCQKVRSKNIFLGRGRAVSKMPFQKWPSSAVADEPRLKPVRSQGKGVGELVLNSSMIEDNELLPNSGSRCRQDYYNK